MVGGSDPKSYHDRVNELFDDVMTSGLKEKEGSDPLQLYEHDIRRFVDAMKYKLRKNAHKGRWESYDHDKALVLLEREVDELREALREGNMVEIMLEAADVANFAMMIAVMSIER